MKTKLSLFLLLVLLPCAAQNRGVIDTSQSPHVKLNAVDLAAVRWTRGFWADRFELVRSVTVPTMWQVMQIPNNAASFRNLRIAAGLEQGKFSGVFWSDGDVYKLLETMAFVYALTGDKKLDQLMDEAIGVIAKAQAPDGYISTQIQLTNVKRWTHFRYHELYNMGHLMTAACIHHRATRKDSFLNVARKVADYLYTVFQPRPKELAHFGFNPSNIMGLVELYRTTRNPKYLELAGIFVDMRGSQPSGTDQNQTRVPLRKETEAVGHAVTGPYLWAGATDVYAETGEKALWDALERLWRNVIHQKMYITGGIAAINIGASSRRDPVHEAFGLNYQLPNAIAYNETCANIAQAMWSWRMLSTTGEAKYTDVMELVLYNSMLSGMGLDGKTYCYTNPLRRHGREEPLLRADSFERWPDTLTSGAPNCYCCPPNVSRTIASLHGWAYSTSDRAVWVNLYGGNVLKTELPDGTPLHINQETDYPWEGKIRITVTQPVGKELAVMLRIPGWAEGASLKVRGQPAMAQPGTYAEVRRTWSAGDTIELDLNMKPRLIEAHPKVEEARNQVAVMRGPMVYCLESPDLPPGIKPHEVALPVNARLTARHDPSLLGGVTVIETQGRPIRSGDWSGKLYRTIAPAKPETIHVKLIPYYAWNNRGVPYMTVWLRAIH
ncbi:MAG: glycoside hydrolase family 127 protein [Acidobacteriota bacterium]